VKKIGLVLGGGGIAGIAYLTTTLSVLQQLTGWDPRSADVIVGTSAGSNMGGSLRGGTPIGESLDDIMTLPTNPRSMERLRELSGREADRTTRLFPTSLKMVGREAARGPFMRPSRMVSGLLPNGNIRTDTIGDRMFELHGSKWPEADLFTRPYACTMVNELCSAVIAPTSQWEVLSRRAPQSPATFDRS